MPLIVRSTDFARVGGTSKYSAPPCPRHDTLQGLMAGGVRPEHTFAAIEILIPSIIT